MLKKYQSIVCLTVFAVSSNFAFAHAETTTSSNVQYDAAIKKIDADYQAASEKCSGMSGAAEDLCKAKVEGARDVGKAEAKAQHEGTAKAWADAHEIKADRNYNVAQQLCDEKTGNRKDVCLKQAKAEHKKAMGAINIEKAKQKGTRADVAEANREATKDTLNSQYQVDKEKCDAMSGDVKDKCISDARAKYGK